MSIFNQLFPIASTRKFFVLLTLALLLANAYVVTAQNTANGTNSNTGNSNINANLNSNANVNTNANGNQNGNANGNVSGNTNRRGGEPSATPDPKTEEIKVLIAKTIWFPLAVTAIFAAVLIPFSMVIVRAIRFSRSTFNSPLGLPEGSLRAMLAFMLVALLGFYVYASVLSFSDFKPPEFLIGIVATVIGFYFGSRTSEDRGATTPRTGTVQGDVTDKTGTSAGGANVELSQPDGKKLTQKADAKGKYKFDNVPAGDYDIQASLQGHAPSDPTRVKVTAGAPLTVDLKLK
ncbi:MAG TPA: carboxypeptidase-like regulatory domain-containing protein [Pyrinomonadaceae bacterium]